VLFAAGVLMVDTTLEFDRAKYGIRYGSGRFFQNLGDNMIADSVSLKAKLSLVPEKELAQFPD